MAAKSAKKFVYEIQAEYTGQQSLRQLQNDLNNIARIDAYREAGRKWQELNEQLRTARENARRLRQEMQASGGGAPLQQREYDQARRAVADLRAELARQRTTLDAARAGLQGVGIAASQAATQYAHLQQAAAASARSMAARNTLGIRGDTDIRAEMEALKKAYRDLATSGTASTQELQRAAENLRNRLRALRQEMQGGGGRVDRARGLLGIRSDAAIEADVARLRRAYETLRQSGAATAAELSRAHQVMTRQIAGLRGESARLSETASKLQGLRAALAGFAAAFAASRLMDQAKSLFRIADEYAGLDAKIRLVTRSEQEAAQVRERLYSLSQRTGTAYGSNADAFSKLALSMREVGIDGEQTARIIEVVNKSLAINGSSAGMAGAFMLQFSQAMASGVLQGDEFRSMMENNGYFAGRLAKHLQTNIAGLRQMSREGKLTQAVLLDFFERAGEEVDRDFAAIPMRVSEAAQTVRNAWEEIIDASNRGSGASAKLVESLTGFARYLEANREGIQELLADIMLLITRVAEMGLAFGKWLADNRELVAIAARSAAAIAGIGAAVRVVTLSTAALSAAWGALTGVMTAGIALAGSFAVALTASAAAVAGAVVAWRDMRRAQGEAAAAQARLAETQKIQAEQLARISGATGVTIRSFQELRQAIDEGRIHYDAATGAWVAGAKKRQEATEDAMEGVKKAEGDALKKLVAEYKKYADEIRRIQDDISGRQKSLTAELREMARSGMTDLDAWNDLKREAEEYAAAAERAAREAREAQDAGDTITAAAKWREAVGYADDARQAYKSLNREVKDGDQVVVSKADALKIAMEGVKRAGEQGIDILKRQQDAAYKAMDDLEKQSGFAGLMSYMDEAIQKWLDGWRRMRSVSTESVEAVSQEIVAQQKEIKIVEDAWVSAARSTRGLWIQLADDLKRKIDEATKTRTVTVYTNVVQNRRWGGLVAGFARGGKVPGGYGGGDRVPAMLEPGEFVLRKEAVKFLTPQFLERLNANVRAVLPDLSVLVPRPAATTSGRAVNINLTMPSGDAYQLTADSATAARIEREQARWWALRSSNRVRRPGFARTP